MTQPVAIALQQASWPASELGAAVGALVRRAGLVAEPPEPTRPRAFADEDLASYMLDASARLGVEIVHVSSTCGELTDLLRKLGPSLLRLPGAPEASADQDGAVNSATIAREARGGGRLRPAPPDGGGRAEPPSNDRFLVVLRGGTFGLSVLTPDAQVRRIDSQIVRDALLGDILAAEQASVQFLVSDLDLATEISEGGLRAFALERLRDVPAFACWLVRSSPAGSVRVHARTAHVALLLSLIMVARALSMMLSILLWWNIGRDVFSGELDRSALTSVSLCLLSIIPLRLLDAWAQARLGLDVSVRLKASLLYGILQLDRAATRGRGIGQILSMAMEGEQSSSAMDSALVMLVSVVELLAALLVLGAGAGGAVHVLLLLCWLVFIGWLCRGYLRRAQRSITAARHVTHDLVERLVGYQTRLVQERPEERSVEEDALLREYLVATQELDCRSLFIDGIVSHGWLVLGIAALLPALASGVGFGPSMAAAIGGVLLCAGCLKRLASGVKELVGCGISWQQTTPILQAGRQALAQSSAGAATAERRVAVAAADTPLVSFDHLSLRYAPDAPAALRGCSQQIRSGDRILLEGPSGGGKSTLAMVLSGLRAADTGEVLLRGEGINQMPLARWRGLVVLVPQFHDNHILTESLLFNLLLGRRWPATREDERAAAAVCDMLGLSPLISSMPQGLAQTVGDGGWALSHGERSRVFLARALLQNQVEVMILDESFAALDPETLREAYHGVLASAPTLLVIAHP